MRLLCRIAVVLSCAWLAFAAAGLVAQEKKPFQLKPKLANPLGELPGFGPQQEGSVYLSAKFEVLKGTREGRLLVKAEIDPGWHIYSVTQPKKGPMPSKVLIDGPLGEAGVEIAGLITSQSAPHVRNTEAFEVPVEEHENEVTWILPLRFAPEANFKTLEIKGHYSGQICAEGGVCIPLDRIDFTAKYEGEYEAGSSASANTPPAPVNATSEFRPRAAHASLSGDVSAAVVPGGEATLTLTARPDDPWHVYAYAPMDPEEISKPTLISLTAPSGWKVSAVAVSAEPEFKPGEKGLPPVHFYNQPVTWTVEVAVPADAKPGKVELTGAVGLQTCTEAQCDRPTGTTFTATVNVGEAVAAGGRAPLVFAEGDYNEVAKAVADAKLPAATWNGKTLAPAGGTGFDMTKLKVQDEVANYPLWLILPIAFVGGFILNFMPCVLPVVGLKILSFVNQAGSDRRRILALNLAYTAGMLAVFLVLANLAVVVGLGWGQQFNYEAFNITLTAIVFAMALSFLGVWEIPVPGFLGGEKAGALSRKEGYLGAAFKGMLTTLLATPCSGPGLATALGWSANKPAHLVYLVFLVIGLGMASPYILIGFQPRLLRFLPKPGAWMDTFKQAMGFVLLGTVVYLFTIIPTPLLVPTFAMLMGLWAACWWFGRIDHFGEFQVRLRGWLVAGTIALAVGWFSFHWLAGVMHERFAVAVDRELSDRIARVAENEKKKNKEHELPWQPYSLAKLESLLGEKKTVLVDFTADWCVTCKTLEATVLNTADVRAAVQAEGVVPLVADWTTRDPQITEMLTTLAGRPNVPVLAIFPANRPNEPIVITGGYTKSTLIAKLREAGEPATNVAMSGE